MRNLQKKRIISRFQTVKQILIHCNQEFKMSGKLFKTTINLNALSRRFSLVIYTSIKDIKSHCKFCDFSRSDFNSVKISINLNIYGRGTS